MKGDLTQEDVARLLSDPSASNRAETAGKVAVQIETGSLSAEGRRMAEDIIRVMARDASVMVREAVALNLKSSAGLPRDVALTLARDIDSVALPVLEFSDVLTDEDLLELIAEAKVERQEAIARRREVSGVVADALVETGSERVVTALVGNDGADLSELTLSRVVDRFGENGEVQTAMVRRSRLPISVSERLVAKLSDHLRDYLVKHHELSVDTASDIVFRARERTILNLASGDAGEDDVVQLTTQLAAKGRLTPSLVLRALCIGDLVFFEAAMAALAGVPVENARILIHDRGPLGLKSIHEKAGLPATLLPTIRTALQIASETHFGAADDRETYSRTVLERILTQCVDLRDEDEAFLLRKLHDLMGDEVAAP